MALLIEWGMTLHNRTSPCLLVARGRRVALAPSRRIPTCHTYLTCRTYLTYLTCRIYLTYLTCRTYLTYRTYLTCLTYLTYRTYLTCHTCHVNKTVPHRRVRHSLYPPVHRLAGVFATLRLECVPSQKPHCLARCDLRGLRIPN